MLEHNYKELVLKNGNKTKKKIIVEFADPDFELLGIFFASEFGNFAGEIKRELDDVLTGKKERSEFTGNLCQLIVDGEESVLYDMCAEDGRGKTCSLNTAELSRLVDEYNERRKI